MTSWSETKQGAIFNTLKPNKMKANKPTGTREQIFNTLQKFIILHILLMEYNNKYQHIFCAIIGSICAFFTLCAGVLFFRLVCALIIAL